MLDALSEFAIQLAVTLADAALLLLATAPRPSSAPPGSTPPGPTPPGLAQPVKDPAAAFLRAGRALLWLSALSNVFTGLYILPRRRPPSASSSAAAPTALAAARPAPRRGAPAARSARPLGEDRWMRTVFSTRPIGHIVTRICRDLGLTTACELWPADFVAITETLPEWAARTLPPQSPSSRTPSSRSPPRQDPSLRASREALAHLRRCTPHPSPPHPSPIGRPQPAAVQLRRSG